MILNYPDLPDVTGTRLPDWKAERTCLVNRLQQGQIPYEVADRLADEIGSISKLERLYQSIKDENCCAQVLTPMFRTMEGQSSFPGTPIEWSTAVYTIFNDDYVNDMFPWNDTANDRNVQIVAPYELHTLLQGFFDGENSSFSLTISNNHTKIPTIWMQTISGRYRSSPIAISILDGDDILCYLKAALISQRDCVKAATLAARTIRSELSSHSEFESSQESNDNSANDSSTVLPNILIIRGMKPGLDKAARMNGFRPELRVLGK
jgi:hypothetical protein